MVSEPLLVSLDLFIRRLLTLFFCFCSDLLSSCTFINNSSLSACHSSRLVGLAFIPCMLCLTTGFALQEMSIRGGLSSVSRIFADDCAPPSFPEGEEDLDETMSTLSLSPRACKISVGPTLAKLWSLMLPLSPAPLAKLSLWAEFCSETPLCNPTEDLTSPVPLLPSNLHVTALGSVMSLCWGC